MKWNDTGREKNGDGSYANWNHPLPLALYKISHFSLALHSKLAAFMEWLVSDLQVGLVS